MNKSAIRYFLGWIMLCEAALLLLPLAVSVIYSEPASIKAFIITILICAALGTLFIVKKPTSRTLYIREGFIITTLTWLIISILGSLPFMISGAITSPVSALFETVSGFTTTGSSILADVESLDKGILFWRSFTHWIGGMGVLVFILMLRPLSGGSTVNIMKAESPGPQVEKLVPRLQSTAQILYAIYIIMTFIQIVVLLLGGMSLFDSVTTTFCTAGTGGFGIKNDSLASYSPFLQNTITIFMILFGVNFSAYFLLLQGKLKKSLMEEVKWYLGIILIAVLIITFNTRGFYGTFGETIRHSAFQVGSVITTTGYSTVNFDLWPALSKTILVILMFVGACAGSTGGGMKVSRILILVKTVKKELKQYLHPQRTAKISLDKKPVEHTVLRATNVYFVTYMLIFVASILLISIDNFDPATNFTAVTATLNNIGPGLSLVGPMENFDKFSVFSKLVLTFDMLIGRLEIFPMLMLLNPAAWRKF